MFEPELLSLEQQQMLVTFTTRLNSVELELACNPLEILLSPPMPPLQQHIVSS